MAKVSVAPAAMVVTWASATTGLLLLLLLLLCSFFRRVNGEFCTLKMRKNSGLVQGVKLVRLSCSDGGATLPGGTPSPGEPQQHADGTTVLEDPGLHVPGWTPHSHGLSGPALRTPEFLRHRELPVLPGDANTSVADPVPDAEGSIYESIRYKSETLKKLWDADRAREDPPSLPVGDVPVQVIALEELGSEGSPSPVYARVCKPPRTPQPQHLAVPSEPQEEEPPSLPEKRFDVA